MNNKLKNLFSPNDLFPILIVILGVLMSIFISLTVVKLIGVGVAILGIIALFMLISQRKSDIVEPKYKPHTQSPNFNITVKNDSTAKRQTFEDYKESIDEEEAIKIKDEEFSKSEISKDEGFRVVSKKTNMSQAHISNTKLEYSKEGSASNKGNNNNPNTNNTNLYTETNSGFKVIGKKKSVETNLDSELLKKDINELMADATELEINDEKKEDNVLGDKKFLRNEKIKIPLDALMDDNVPEGGEPRKEFEYYLDRILEAICSVSNTKTATFLIVNYQTDELVLESSFSDTRNIYPVGSRFKIDNDIISQIVKNNSPEILSEINSSAELELIPYYTQSQDTLSFIGIPVFMNDVVIGVITADSNITDAYDSMTVSFMSHFTKMVAALLSGYIEKFDLVNASKTLEVIESFRINSNAEEFSYRSIYESILNTVSNMIDCSSVGICGFDDKKGDWFIVSEVLNTDDSISLLDSHIDSSTLLGKTLIEAKSIHLNEFNNNTIRVSSKEKDKKIGFFLSIPLVTHTTTYGALYIEGDDPGLITQNDIEVISILAEHAALSIEKLHFMEILQSSALTDNDTGLLNIKAFYSQLDNEFSRSKDTGEKFCISLIKVDKYSSLDPNKYQQRMQSVLVNIINIINNNKKKYDFLGSLEDDTFCILLVGMNSESAKIWCERVRNEIAISVLEVDNKKFNVTTSIGLAENITAKSADSLIDNATIAINKSLEKTNSVTLFN